MNDEEYRAQDATALARLIATRQISAAEALAAARTRRDQVNERLNAILTPMDEIADARAAETVAGPFAGVPFLLKDLFQDYAGVPATYGNRALKRSGFRPVAHAEITRRFIASGVNCFGTTNAPEFGAKAITEPAANGATRNPWNPAHTPGGSSGGAAAAVAAGIVPMAGASDGGGSIRIPAACCGLFGLKPGRARVPGGPTQIDAMHGAAVNHVLTRSVRDSAAMLDAVAGYEPGAIVRLPAPEIAYREVIERPPAALRIGVMADSPLGHPLHADARAALEHGTRVLTDLGHHVEAAGPAIDGPAMARDFLTLWFVQMARAVAGVRVQTGCGADGFELDTRAMAHLGRALSACEYADAYGRMQHYRQMLADFHVRFDLLMTPTLAEPPAVIGALNGPAWQRLALAVLVRLPTGRALLRSGIVARLTDRNLRPTPFTQLANMTGVPAMSVPLSISANGLPQGTQFVAPPGGEALLLQLAAQLEEAAPWFDKRPSL